MIDDGHLVAFTEGVEYRGIGQEIVYTFNAFKSNNINSCEEIKEHMQRENSDELNNIKINSIDMMSLKHLMIKNGYETQECHKKIIKIIQEKYKSLDKKLFNIIDIHLWYETHARLLNRHNKKLSLCESLVKGYEEGDDEPFDDHYEKFEEIKEMKQLLMKDIDVYHDMLLSYFNKL
jgi:hypothetical protein